MNSARRVIVVFCLFSFLVPFRAIGADPLTEDERWEVLNPEIEGVDGSIYAMSWYNDQLCISGDFRIVKNIVSFGQACLDPAGDTWTDIHDSEFYGQISILLPDRKGNLYALHAEGDNVSGTQYYTYVTRWDGTAWQFVVGTTNPGDEILSIALDSNDDLYVAGDFDAINGEPLSDLAKWDGTSWSSLNSGLAGSTIEDMAFDESDRLYLFGNLYLNVGGTVYSYDIARSNGADWEPIETATGGYSIRMILPHGNDLYAAGSFTEIGGVSALHIARWDGSVWHPLGEGLSGYVQHIGFDRHGTLYAAEAINHESFTQLGYARVSFFDGAQWQVVCDAIDGAVNAFAFDADDKMYLGGDFLLVGDHLAASIVRGTKDNWETIGAPGVFGQVYATALDTDGTLYVGDNRSLYYDVYGNQVSVGLPKKRTGAAWQLVGGIADKAIFDMTIHQNEPYMGGAFYQIGDTPTRLIARWDGSSWRPLDQELSTTADGGIIDLLSYDSYLYAAGAYVRPDDNPRSFPSSPFRWDGTSWESLGNFDYAVSIIFDDNGVPYILEPYLVRRFDGTDWQPVGDYFNFAALDIAFGKDGTLYAGGYYTDEYDVPFARVARWDGSTWQFIAEEEGLFTMVYALEADDTGDIYAAGTFMEIGGVAANSIARWDGTAWHAMGNGVEGEIYELMIGNDRRLYVGGYFATAGGKFSPHITAYKLDELPDDGTPDDDAVTSDDDSILSGDGDTIIPVQDNAGVPDDGNVPDDGTTAPDEETKTGGDGCGCSLAW